MCQLQKELFWPKNITLQIEATKQYFDVFFFNMLNVTFQIKAAGPYLCVVLFTTLYRIGIPLCITIKVKSFHAIIFIVLYKAIWTLCSSLMVVFIL